MSSPGADRANEDFSEGKEIAVITITTLFLVLSWISVSLRVYVRAVMIRAFGIDDWLILLTLLFFTIQSALLLALTYLRMKYGLGSLQVIERLVEYCVLEIAFYFCTSITLKLSLAFFFLRVIIERWQRWVVYISVTIYTAYSFTFLFVAVFQCGSPAHFLIRHLLNQCIPWHRLAPPNYLHSALNAVVDWIFAILPIFVLRNAQMSWRSKWSVCFILSLGALGSVASLVRLAFVEGMNFLGDFTFGKAVNMAIASISEPGLGIVAVSLATLRPLFRLAKEKTRKGRSLSADSHIPTEGSNQQQRQKDSNFASPSIVTRAMGGDKNQEKSSSIVLLTTEDEISVSTLPTIDDTSSNSITGEINRKTSRKDSWTDLESARKNWDRRRWDSEGSARVQPSLLLPDTEDAEEPGKKRPEDER